jgi:hypothetical protein
MSKKDDQLDSLRLENIALKGDIDRLKGEIQDYRRTLLKFYAETRRVLGIEAAIQAREDELQRKRT